MKKVVFAVSMALLLLALLAAMGTAMVRTADPVEGRCYEMISAPNIESLSGEMISVDTLAYCQENMDTKYLFSQLSQRIRPGENVVLTSDKPFYAQFNGQTYNASAVEDGYISTVLTGFSSVSNIKVAACGAQMPSYGVLIVFPGCER